MNLRWHERVAFCGLGERLPTRLRKAVLPFEHRFEMLLGLSSSLSQELCCLFRKILQSARGAEW